VREVYDDDTDCVHHDNNTSESRMLASIDCAIGRTEAERAETWCLLGFLVTVVAIVAVWEGWV
jgi:hypothetical protein